MRERPFCQEIHQQVEEAQTPDELVAGFHKNKNEPDLVRLQGETRNRCSLVIKHDPI